MTWLPEPAEPSWHLFPVQLLAHCPQTVAIGWKESLYQFTQTAALVNDLPGARIEFCPGPGRIDLQFHKHAWSGGVEIEINGAIERHDLYEYDAHPLATLSIEIPDEGVVTIRALPRQNEESRGDEIWFVGASWKVRPPWFPTPDPMPRPGRRRSEWHIELQDAELLREFHCSDDPLDIFDSYANFEDRKFHCCRRWFGQARGRIGGFRDSRVVVGGNDLDYGDDPRLFVHQGRLCTVSATYSSLHGFRNHLIVFDAPDRWSRHFLMPPLGLDPGKNWSPFEDSSGRLNFVHSFSPLVVLREIRRERGIILLEARTETGILAEDGADGFPAHRGGTNGLRCGTLIFGIGHTTRLATDRARAPVYHPHCLYPSMQQLVHRPFGWLLDPASLAMAVFDVEHDWNQHYWIVDPTSLTWNPLEEHFEVFTTEVERNFCDPTSRGRTMSYKIPQRKVLEIAKAILPSKRAN